MAQTPRSLRANTFSMVNMDAVKLNDSAVMEMLRWYQASGDTAEMTRELCTRLLRHLGVWSLTIPLEALAVLLTKGKVASQGVHEEDCTLPDFPSLHCDITTDCLAVLPQPGRLGTLAGLSSMERRVITNECSQACTFLGDWMWMPGNSDVQNDLYKLIWEAWAILQDVRSYSDAVAEKDTTIRGRCYNPKQEFFML